MTAVVDLIGADLALWVARACGYTDAVAQPRRFIGAVEPRMVCARGDGQLWMPQDDWAQGGPLIKQFNVQLGPPTNPVHRCGGPNAGHGQSGVWTACTWTRGANGRRSITWHESEPLIAAMRCIVRFVYGDTVPDEVAP